MLIVACGPIFKRSLLINLPVTFDATNVNYTVTDFGNNSTVDAVDPTSSSNKVKKTTKPSGAETWAGTTIGTPLISFIDVLRFKLSIATRAAPAAATIASLVNIKEIGRFARPLRVRTDLS